MRVCEFRQPRQLIELEMAEGKVEKFEAKMNMAMLKNERVHDLLKAAHTYRVQDVHKEWKAVLDSIRSEVRSYVDPEAKTKLDELRKKGGDLILEYLKSSSNGGVKSLREYQLQEKQIELEDALDDYQCVLVDCLKQLGMDMVQKEDTTMVFGNESN